MSRQFEQRLNECLEALSSGKRTLEQCLSMYPEDAARLEPLLRTASLLEDTFAKEPRPEFAAKSRERFLRMTERGLRQSLAVEPRPSFVMAARRRFLSAAQQMIPNRQPSPWRPAFRMAAAAAGVLVMFFVSLGGFAVTTSADSLPGDWQYPVKRTIEDVRYTFTFDSGGRQSLDIEFTHERLNEVQKLGEKGRTIGEGPLDDLADQTNSLAKTNLKPQDAEKVAKLGLEQQQVLAQVAPLVEPNANDELQEAKTVSAKVYVNAASIVLANQEGQTTTVSPASTEEPEENTPTAQPGEGTPTESAPAADTPTPAPEVPEVTPIPGAVVVAPIDNDNTGGVSWELLVVDRFSVQVPSEASGWHLLGLDVDPYGVASAPFLLRVTNADLTAIIVINPRNGDVYWEQYSDGLFRELFVRKSDGPVVWQASEGDLRAFGPDDAEIVLHVANSISITPPPTATPTPVPSPTPEATTGASGDAATATPAPGA